MRPIGCCGKSGREIFSGQTITRLHYHDLTAMNGSFQDHVRSSAAYGILVILVTNLWGYLEDGDMLFKRPLSFVLGVILFAVMYYYQDRQLEMEKNNPSACP